MAAAYQVAPYSIGRLTDILKSVSFGNGSQIGDKFHLAYFKEYFQALDAKTIIVENDYVDHDYLEDYSAYYVRCLTDYRRRCSRIHFFSREFSSKEFTRLLSGEPKWLSEALLNESYLGFIVVRPLPYRIIGRTCLKLYDDDDHHKRHFPCKREYTANLFGIQLTVETIAFQEQDRVVAACATSALWSVFQSTGQFFHHHIPSPVQITKAATSNVPIRNRAIPNAGLNIEQIANAIRSVDLEPIELKVMTEEIFLNTVYAYLRGGIPLIAGIDLYDCSTQTTFFGKHAVAIFGYSLGRQNTRQLGVFNLKTVASCIDKIYAHDDQIGPFARMLIDQISVNTIIDGDDVELFSISTSWPLSDGSDGGKRAVPFVCLIPLYHKIRIPFETIYDGIGLFDSLMTDISNANGAQWGKLSWDMYLTTVKTYKSELFQSSTIDSRNRHEILTKPMPRFMWRAIGSYDGNVFIDLAFDATDIADAPLLVRSIEPSQDYSSFIRTVAKHPHARRIVYEKGKENYTAISFVLKLFEQLTSH